MDVLSGRAHVVAMAEGDIYFGPRGVDQELVKSGHGGCFDGNLIVGGGIERADSAGADAKSAVCRAGAAGIAAGIDHSQRTNALRRDLLMFAEFENLEICF